MEEKIFFRSGEQEIEGLLDRKPGDRGVAITHPHPLYGGNMYNPVVEAIASSYRRKGYSTLRFNFRGVGRSGGRYENGIGEQEDVISALSYLRRMEITMIDLAGYSFGTFVNSEAVRSGALTERMIMVSPPFGFMEFGEPFPLNCLKLVVTGSRDDLAPPGLLYKILPLWNPETSLEVIEGADHFYAGYENKLEALLFSHI